MKLRLAPLVSLTALLSAPVAWSQTTTTSLAGIGASEATPVGEWRLPDGVELARPLTGYSVFTPDDCAPPEDPQAGAEPPEGAGALVQLCMVLRHTGAPGAMGMGTPIRVVIPPGVIFISDDISTQNGIIIKRVIKEIIPGQTLYIPVMMMCLNDTRSGSHPGAGYKFGPQLQNPAFDALFKRLEHKKIPDEAVAEVQMAVWQVAEGKPISDRVNAIIDALPNE